MAGGEAVLPQPGTSPLYPPDGCGVGLIPLINRAWHTHSEFTMSTSGAFQKVQGLHFLGVEISEKTSIVAAQLLFVATPFPLPPSSAAGDGSSLGKCSLISSP